METQYIFINKAVPPLELDFYNKKRVQLGEYLGFREDDFDPIFKKYFLSKYSQKHRAYHNLTHILSFLKVSEYQTIRNRKRFELAIWFHDIIYQPYFKDNEARSVKYFLKFIKKLKIKTLSAADIEWISTAIASTYGHYPRVEDYEIKLFLDIDLAILATDWRKYSTYTLAIRREYRMYPKRMYCKGRAKAMAFFLKREQIYFTEAFQKLEPQARRNIEKELLEFPTKPRRRKVNF